MEFNYVNIVGEGCEGWLNLFFGDYCLALIDDVELANEIRQKCKERNA